MLLNKALFLVLDTETTGFDHKEDKVVQIGAVWLDSNFDTVDTYESLVCPGEKRIPAGASAIHHLIDEDVEKAPRLEEVLKEIERRGKYNCIAAHNAPFDMGFIKPPSDIPVIDTLRLARKLWPDIESHKNQFLRYHFQLKVPRDLPAHSALPDALSTAAFLKFALEHMKSAAKDPNTIDIPGLLEWLAKPMNMSASKARFGKHKGKTWSEIAQQDRSYLSWMIGPKGMSELDEDLKHTVQRLLG